MSENLNLQEDAKIKFDKLCEIVKDIEINGQDGDQFARQVVFSAIVTSENNLLITELEKALLEYETSELMKTVLVGLLMQKGNIDAICQYAESIIEGITTIKEEFENKESLLLLADALVKGTESEDEALKNRSCKILFNLYKASCHAESTALIADNLLQRFINILPQKNNDIDSNLLKLIKDVEVEINARIISIDILSRSQPVDFFETAMNLISELKNYSRNSIEKIYLLDVLTKYITNASSSKLGINFTSLSRSLFDIELSTILDEAKCEHGSNNEHFDIIYKRINRRIAQINELVNSKN